MPKRKDQTPPGTLHEITRELLKADAQTTFDVAVGTELSYSWIVAFACGRMKNPSVSKVQRLYEYLTGKPLALRR
jgi:hypothetical protein